MEKLLKFLITQIVNQPEAVEINRQIDADGTVILTVAVAPEDMGKIIGKSGKTISAVRELIKIKAIKLQQRVRVILAEPPITQTDSASPPLPSELPPDKS